MDNINMQEAVERLKSAAANIRSREDAINFLMKETKMSKADCEKAFDAIASMDFKELASKLPAGFADKLPSDITKKFGF